MNTEHTSPGRAGWRDPRNAVIAIVAAAGLLGGAAWRGVPADAAAGGQRAGAVTADAPASGGRAGALAGRDSFADVVTVIEPSVVTIRTEGRARVSPTQFRGDDEDLLRRFFGQDFEGHPGMQGHPGITPQMRRERALGSGVVVSADGYILTNFHVVDRAEVVKVDLGGNRTLDAKVIGTDKPSDLAVLKVNAADLHPIAFGNSDAVQTGDVVLAVGNPLGIGETVTMGIISAKGRSTGAGDGSYEDFLQTDAPINHGNSGGALVNTRGELIGINSQIISPSDGNIGIGFAIPVNMAKNVMDQLRKTGRVERSQLGVTVQAVTSDMAASLGLKSAGGAIVSSVAEGSAAARAGLRQGDVIESFNGQPVNDTNTLRNRVAEAHPGSTANLTVLRDGQERKFDVKLDAAKGSEPARDTESDSGDKGALGVAVAPVTPDLAARVGAPKNAHGLFVQDVNPDGRAAEAGIQPGDIIEQVNRKPVQTVEDLRSALHGASDRPLLLLVNRNGDEVYVTVPAA